MTHILKDWVYPYMRFWGHKAASSSFHDFFAASQPNYAECAHLVIDVQRQFCDPSYAGDRLGAQGNEETENVAASLAQTIIPAFKSNRILHIFAYFAQCGDDDYSLSDPSLHRGGFYQVCPDQDDITMAKYRNDVFRDTDLLNLLKGRGIKTLIVSGVNAGHCVGSSVESALKKKFNVCVLVDAIGTGNFIYPPGTVEAAKYMKKKGAFLASSTQLLGYMAAASVEEHGLAVH